MARRGSRPGKISARRHAWISSTEFKIIRRNGLQKAHRVTRHAEKCGAKRKQDGKSCLNVGMENGRCRLHGGMTPKGNQWHLPQYPKHTASEAKMYKKLSELERRRKKLAARIASMSPDEREKYDKWQRSHKPGGKAERERRRRDREARKSLIGL